MSRRVGIGHCPVPRTSVEGTWKGGTTHLPLTKVTHTYTFLPRLSVDLPTSLIGPLTTFSTHCLPLLGESGNWGLRK